MNAQYHVRQRAAPDAPIPCASCGTRGRAEQLYFDILEMERARKSGGTP